MPNYWRPTALMRGCGAGSPAALPKPQIRSKPPRLNRLKRNAAQLLACRIIFVTYLFDAVTGSEPFLTHRQPNG